LQNWARKKSADTAGSCCNDNFTPRLQGNGGTISGSSTLSDYRMSIYVTQASVGTLSASHALIAVTRVLGGVEQQVTNRTWMDIEDEKPDGRKECVL
jgi:hypothetical protein